MNKITITLVHLYPKELNIYGDTGNVQVLKKRLEWRGFGVDVTQVGIGDSIPQNVDFILVGGGQDAAQGVVAQDLYNRKSEMKELATRGVVMLLVCGGYQLFGRHFLTSEGVKIPGIGILPAETRATANRLVGNIVIERNGSQLVGYENHSGQTVVDDGAQLLGTVLKGAGNSKNAKTEGCVVNNVFGTYMHGPLLNKNPQFADELVLRMLKKHNIFEIAELDDTLEMSAHKNAIARPR